MESDCAHSVITDLGIVLTKAKFDGFKRNSGGQTENM
jgi:hypothetical protein